MSPAAGVFARRPGLADGTAVKYTRNPTALRSALEKLAVDSTVVRARSSSVAHLWIECPLDQTSSLNRLFSTHPPLGDRIAAIWKLEGGVGAPPSIMPAGNVAHTAPEIHENDVDWTTGERKSNWRSNHNANDLNDVKQATNAKWVKWAIGIFAVLFLGPVLLIKITELINSITNALPG